MAFTVEQFADLVRLLEERPEWRAELRRLVLTDELLALPAAVRALAEAQARTEEKLTALAEAQARTEEKLAALAADVGRLATHVGGMAEALKRTEETVLVLVHGVSDLRGDQLERRYRPVSRPSSGRRSRRSGC